jgi:hypothetical protein
MIEIILSIYDITKINCPLCAGCSPLVIFLERLLLAIADV